MIAKGYEHAEQGDGQYRVTFAQNATADATDMLFVAYVWDCQHIATK